MAQVFTRRLFRYRQTAQGNSVVWLVPSGQTTVLRHVILANHASVAVAGFLYIDPGGSGPVNWIWAGSIPQSTVVMLDLRQELAAGEQIHLSGDAGPLGILATGFVFPSSSTG